jgi:hypothetical protein
VKKVMNLWISQEQKYLSRSPLWVSKCLEKTCAVKVFSAVPGLIDKVVLSRFSQYRYTKNIVLKFSTPSGKCQMQKSTYT